MSNYKYKYLKYKKKYLFLKNQTGGMYNYLFGASDNPTPWCHIGTILNSYS